MTTETTNDQLGLAPTRLGGHPLARCPMCDAICYGYEGLGATVITGWTHTRACPYRLVSRADTLAGHADPGWR